MRTRQAGVSVFGPLAAVMAIGAVLAIAFGVSKLVLHSSSGSTGDLGSRSTTVNRPLPELRRGYSERLPVIDTSGFLGRFSTLLPKWNPDVSLEELSAVWRGDWLSLDRGYRQTAR